VDIAVIRLPYISNYTDFAPLGKTAGVKVRYVSDREELGTPDLIILPGTKNTLGDLRWLRETGLAEKISEMVPGENGPLLIGICGGYQMLGERILDPLGSEAGGAEKGLGFLPVETVFREEKYTRQRSGRTCRLAGPWALLSDLPVSGYEIHMGDSKRYEGYIYDLYKDNQDDCPYDVTCNYRIIPIYDYQSEADYYIVQTSMNWNCKNTC
jgi:adenosylcobyric acid synthase